MKTKVLYVGMKYDYGDKARGLSFEHRNFYHSLKSYSKSKIGILFTMILWSGDWKLV